MTAEYAGEPLRLPAQRWDYPARVTLRLGFDIEDYAASLFAHVVGREMRRRLPNAHIRFRAPTGSHSPRFDGRLPLGARASDVEPAACVVFGGPPRFEVVAVDDVDLEHPLPAIASPPSEFAAHAPRAFTAGVLQKRLEFLKHIGRYPKDGGAVVVQPDSASTDTAEALTTIASRSPVVLAPLAEGDRRVADQLSARLSFPHWLLPCDVTLVDLVATIGGASLFAGSDINANVTAAAFGRKQVLLGKPADASFGLRTGFLGDLVSALTSTAGPDQGIAAVATRAERLLDVLAHDVVAVCSRAAGVAAPPPHDRAASQALVRALIASEAHATARIRDRVASVEALAAISQRPFVPIRRRMLRLLGRALPIGIRESATVQAVYTRLIRRR